jgi:ADP-ribosyl-[dinitrogen reductase] hydrolase
VELSQEVSNRAIGVVLGGAVGDALGAGYEFGPPVDPATITMLQGVATKEPPGHWTDDTAMAIAILETAAQLGRLDTDEAATRVSARFLEWFRSDPQDIGIHTREVLSRANRGGTVSAAALEAQALNPTAAGNGSLMRTGPVALAHLGDREALVSAARTMSSLTHAGELAGDACVLWTLAIDHAVRTGELLGPQIGLDAVPDERREQWSMLLDEAERLPTETFTRNGYVVTALQAAWSAICATRDDAEPFESALRRAISIGDDTDTVAAIAGSLVGARCGGTAVPRHWREGLAGWPRGYGHVDLMRLAVQAAHKGEFDEDRWPEILSLYDI